MDSAQVLVDDGLIKSSSLHIIDPAALCLRCMRAASVLLVCRVAAALIGWCCLFLIERVGVAARPPYVTDN